MKFKTLKALEAKYLELTGVPFVNCEYTGTETLKGGGTRYHMSTGYRVTLGNGVYILEDLKLSFIREGKKFRGIQRLTSLEGEPFDPPIRGCYLLRVRMVRKLGSIDYWWWLEDGSFGPKEVRRYHDTFHTFTDYKTQLFLPFG